MVKQTPPTPQQTPPEEQPNDTLRKAADGYSLGIHFVVCVLISGFAGYWLDVWLGTLPLFMLLLLVFGFAAGIWHIIKKTS